MNAKLNKSPERGHRPSLSLDRAYAYSLLAYVLPQWLFDFDAPHHRELYGPSLYSSTSTIASRHHHHHYQHPSFPSSPSTPVENYRRGRRFDRCEWEVSREASVPVPCAPDVDYFEHHSAGGVSSYGAFEGGYQDGFEEVLRLFPSESVWLSFVVVAFEPAVFVPSHRHLHPQSLRATT